MQQNKEPTKITMMENRTLEEFLWDYSKGKRHFLNWNFDEALSVKGIDLSDIHFEGCSLFLDFREANLINSKFIACNIKTVDFRDSNLTNAVFKECLVESVMFRGAITKNMIFEDNYCFGITVDQRYFEEYLKDSD